MTVVTLSLVPPNAKGHKRVSYSVSVVLGYANSTLNSDSRTTVGRGFRRLLVLRVDINQTDEVAFILHAGYEH
jgi:hypothetical protein